MDFLVFFLIGLAGNLIGTLVGGGGLISLPTMLLMGFPIHSAIGANKVSNTISSFTSFYVIFKQREVSLQEAVSVLCLCLVGGITGGVLASFMKEDWLMILAICLLGFAFLTSFLGKGNFDGDSTFQINKKAGTALFGIGVYDGVFGPGSSTLAMYVYASQKIAYIRAVGLARVGVFASCFGASISYIAAGHIYWPLTIALLCGAIIGAQLGVKVARKLKSSQVKPLLRIVTLLLMAQIIYDFFK